jgi:3-oxoacyl-[acyl-carrier-protein] synthase III
MLLSNQAWLKRCLVIGSETLSRVVDDHDRDSMIYSDGAGATIIETSEDETGLLSYESATYALEEANSYNTDLDPDTRYIKMNGRKIYEFIMPMCIYELGNSSVATVPTLFDLLVNNQIEGHKSQKAMWLFLPL